jgi:hypothetical protein
MRRGGRIATWLRGLVLRRTRGCWWVCAKGAFQFRFLKLEVRDELSAVSLFDRGWWLGFEDVAWHEMMR